MAKRSGKSQELVAVAHAEDFEQARNYEALLKADSIPVVIKQQKEPSTDDKTIVVMVPEDCIDEAHVVIESQDAYDDFYDLASENEQDGDFDDNLLEESF